MAQQFIPTPGGNIYPNEDTDYDQSESFRKVALNRDVVDSGLVTKATALAAADASAKDVTIDAKASSAVSTANSAVSIANRSSADSNNAVGRVTALESAAGFGPSTPTDGTMASHILNPASLTGTALSAAIGETVWDVSGPAGSIEGDTAAVLAACTAAETVGRSTVTMAPGHYLLDGLTVTDIKSRYLTGDGVTFSKNSWVYPFQTTDNATLSANRGRTTGHGRIAIEVDDALLDHWHYLFPATKNLGITVGTAWHTDNGSKWVAEAHRHGWEVIAHLPENITAPVYNAAGALDAMALSCLAKIEGEIGTRENIGFVYPQHVRDLETDRILSKYFTRGRGKGEFELYRDDSGHPWLTSAYPLDSNFAGGVMSATLKKLIRQVATLGGATVFYMHLHSGNYATQISALTELVGECRRLGIEIVNPGQIWGDRNIVEDPYLNKPSSWLLGQAATLDSTVKYHGANSVKVTTPGASVGTGSARSADPVQVPTRPGMFSAWRASVRYRTTADIQVTANGQGFLWSPSLRRRNLDGTTTMPTVATASVAYPEVGTTIPAGEWVRLQSLIYIGPEIDRIYTGLAVQNIAAGSPPVWMDEIKMEHVDWVSSVTYETTLIGTGNAWLRTSIPNTENYNTQIIPATPPAGQIYVSSIAANSMILKSTNATDTMKVKVIITPGSSYGSLTLTSAGA